MGVGKGSERRPMLFRSLVVVFSAWLCVGLGMDDLVGAQESATGASSETPKEASPSQDAGGEKEKKKRGFRVSIPGMAREKAPTTKRVGDAQFAMQLQTQSAFEGIGQSLERPNRCEMGVDTVNPATHPNAPGTERDIIQALVSPLGMKASDFNFEWYESDVANCKTDLRRPNTFACSTALLEMKFTDENKEGQQRSIEEMELAFIFAHEIAHILRGHDKGAARAARRAEFVQNLASAGALVGALSEARYSRDGAGNLKAEMGTDSLNAVWLAAAIGDALTDSSCDLTGADYAREQESEADYVAIDLLMNANWGVKDGSGAERVRQDRIVSMLTALKAESDLKFERTSKTLSGGLQEYASRALLESMTGKSLAQQGLGGSTNDFLKTQALRIGLSMYSDYRMRQGLAFHPDPARRAERITAYMGSAWQAEVAAAQTQSFAALNARYAVRDTTFSRNLATTTQIVRRTAVAPADMIQALVELTRLEQDLPTAVAANATAEAKAAAETAAAERTARIAALRTEIDSLSRVLVPGQNAYPDFALAQYHSYRKSAPLALRHAVAATNKAGTSPDMFRLATEFQIDAKQLPAAKATLDRGIIAHGDAEFFPLMLRVADLSGDEAGVADIRQRCVASVDASPATKQLCQPNAAMASTSGAAQGATTPSGAAPAGASSLAPASGNPAQSLQKALESLPFGRRKAEPAK